MNLSVEPNERITFKIRHEDDDVLVVEKPPGTVSQPGKGHLTNSLLNGLFARYGQQLQNLGKARDFGMLHRLDKPTSGLLIVALRPRAYDALREAFAARNIRKFYWAVCRGSPNKPSGVIRRPILETTDEMKTARISSAGKPALTAYRVLETSMGCSLIECRPVTGRLHQIRVHLDSIGSSILGDDLYGPAAMRHVSPRLALHAHRIAFTHPITGEPIDVRSPWPRDLRSLLRRLRMARPDLPATGVDQVEDLHEVAGDAVGEEEPGVGEPPTSG